MELEGEAGPVFPRLIQLGNELVTVTRMADADTDEMNVGFVTSFATQYASYSLADLGKGATIDPRTGKPYESVTKWLEVVAEGEAEEYLTERSNSNRFDIIARNAGRELTAYTAIKIMHDGRVAYLAQGFIRPDYQRRGAEGSFLRQILPLVMPESVDIYTLLVRSPHNYGAMRAHEANGFIQLEKRISDKYADSLEYPVAYYIAMAKPAKSGIEPNAYIAGLLGMEWTVPAEAGATATPSS